MLKKENGAIFILIPMILVLIGAGISIIQSNKSVLNKAKELEYVTEKTENEQYNTEVLFALKNNKYINKYGYIKESYEIENESCLVDGEIINLNDKKINDDILNVLTKLKEGLEISNFYNKITKIKIDNVKKIDIYIDSEGKVIHLGDTDNLNNKIVYIQEILNKENGISGEIYVEDITKVNFKEKKE